VRRLLVLSVIFWFAGQAPTVADDPPPAVSNPPAGEEQSTPKAVLKVGETAPPFRLNVLNPDASGVTAVSSKLLFGPTAPDRTGPTVLSFASVHCKPCMQELPALHDLYVKLKPSGLNVLVISIDADEADIASMVKVVCDHKVAFPVLSDRLTILARRYHADELPYVLLVGPDGVIRWTAVGYREGVLDELEAAAVLLLKREPPVSPESPREER